MEVIDYVALGQEIKKCREKKQMTQEKLAENVGLSSTHISNIETAHTKVSLTSLVVIANELCVSLDELLSNSLICYKTKNTVADANNYTPKEIEIMNDVMCALRSSFKKYKNA